jgi:hypothetical protein
MRAFRTAVAFTALAGIALLTFYRARTAPQINDAINAHAYDEMRAWAAGTPVRGSTEYGPARTSRCGIFYLTHHPLLASYLGVAAIKLDLDPRLPTQLGIAVLSGAFAASCIMASIPLGLGIVVLLIGYLLYAPGYYEWLSFPIGHTWAFAMYFAAGLAGASRRWYWLPIVAFFMGCFSIDAVVWHAAIIAGVTYAAWGFSLTTVGIGLLAVFAYCFANVLHLIQVACHFCWDLNRVWMDYFIGINGRTSLMFRVGGMGIHERWILAQQYMWSYGRELFVNQHAHWTIWPIAALMPAACAWLLAFVPNMRCAVALVIFTAIFLSAGFFVPNLLAPHLHYLVRYYLLLPIGGIAIVNAGLCQGQGRDQSQEETNHFKQR